MTRGVLRRAARHIDGAVRRAVATRNDGVVPFRIGRFAVAADRPAFAARLFYETRQLDAILSRQNVTAGHVLEVGCGYGRLSPWLAARSESFAAVEPNDRARRRARRLYPDIDVRAGTAQDLPFATASFDLVVTWTVLQHVPDAGIGGALSELERVTRPSGHLLLTEKTGGDATPIVFPRPPKWYANQLGGFELVVAEPRRVEPTFGPTHSYAMLFGGEP